MTQRNPQPPIVSAPTFIITNKEGFNYVAATGIFGGIEPNGGKMIFFLDRLKPTMQSGGSPGNMVIQEVNRELQVEVHMSPLTFKSIANWMVQNVQNYEITFGVIQEPSIIRSVETGERNRLVT